MRTKRFKSCLVVAALGMLIGVQGRCFAQTTPLANWFAAANLHPNAGFIGSPKVLMVGDSTTLNATYMFMQFARFYQQPGERLFGTDVINMGVEGNTLANWLADGSRGEVGISKAISFKPALLVISYGINDVRFGSVNSTAVTRMLMKAVSRFRALSPKTDFVLWGPNAFLSDDPTAAQAVKPLRAAQLYSSTLYKAYDAMAGKPNVLVIQKQDVLGRVSLPSAKNPAGYMMDQVHPGATGELLVAAQLAIAIGRRSLPPIERIAAAAVLNPSAPHLIEPRAVEVPLLYDVLLSGEWSAQGDGWIEVSALPTKPIQTSDLIVLGHGGPVFVIPQGGAAVAFQNGTRLLNLGAGNPPKIEGGTVSVVRRKL